MTSVVKRLLPGQMIFWSDSDVEEFTFLLYMWLMELLQTKDFGLRYRLYNEQVGTALLWDETTRGLLSEARSALFYNSDAVRLKLATWKCVFLKVSNQLDAEAVFKAEGLPADCADLYMYMFKDRFFWSTMRKALRTFVDPIKMQDLTFDFDQLRSECDEDFALRKVKAQVKYLVRKHVKWIADSNNESLTWLEQDIMGHATAYYYKVRPLRNRLYALNYAKSSIGGRINQLLAYWSKIEHARLREETGSMKNLGNAVVVSCNDPEILASQEGNGRLTWAELLCGAS